MENVKQKIIDNKFTRWIYSKIWYFETGNNQIARVVGKGPEIMAFIYLFEKITGFILTRNIIIGFITFYVILCFSIGFLYKFSGLYNTERYVQTSKDPVQTEILESARIIKLKYKKRDKPMTQKYHEKHTVKRLNKKSEHINQKRNKGYESSTACNPFPR